MEDTLIDPYSWAKQKEQNNYLPNAAILEVSIEGFRYAVKHHRLQVVVIKWTWNKPN
jgi:hypothetical protein